MNLGFSFQRTIDATLAMLYPTACHVCGEMVESWRDGIACCQCWAEVGTARESEISCVKCEMPLQQLPQNLESGERRCGRCDEFAFSHVRSCGPYRGALRENVLWLKRNPQIAPRLRRLLQVTFERLNEIEPIESIIPVPLHSSRLAERTFNQAEVIARAIVAETDLRVDATAVVRAKQTEMHRAGMGARERARSLERAFQVRAPRLVKDRRLLVVDDVLTTGSTAHEMARTLVEGGAKSVAVLTLARAMNEFIS
ncbi:MAG: phosphoribosyltransferase family protein [Blastocatellia bacterium]